MQTQLDHNAYSAWESDSEEPESGELSALLSNPDLDVANSLALADPQEPSEAGGEQRSWINQPQPAVVDYEQEEEKADFNEDYYSPPMNQSPLEASDEQGFNRSELVATVPPVESFNNPAVQVNDDQGSVQARDRVRTGQIAVPQPPSGQRPMVNSSAGPVVNGSVAGGESNGNIADLSAGSQQRGYSADAMLSGQPSVTQGMPKPPVRKAPSVPARQLCTMVA